MSEESRSFSQAPSESIDSEESKVSTSYSRKRSFITPEKDFHYKKEVPESKLSRKGVNIFVRFRPDNAQEEQSGRECIIYHPNQKTVTLDSEGSSHSFKFKRIFPAETSQEQIFLNAGLPLVDPILNGYNCAILGYGQTGGGKTHTLLGPGYDRPDRVGKCPDEQKGIAPRLLQSIFHQIYSSIGGDVTFKVYASYIQIYLETIKDLLNPAKDKLKVYQDVSKGLWVTDATKVPAKSVKEVVGLLELGTKYRVTASTNSNSESSRSHAFLVLTITKHLIEKGTYRASQVYIADLCGSERVIKTGAESQRLIEAQNINRSLLALGNVISALAEKRKHVPYRDSKLTRILQNCFGGNSYTTILLNCSSNSVNALETLSTLRFGDRANKVTNKPIVNQKESIHDLRRLLTEANAKIISQQKLIRSQNEKIIEMEIMMQHLCSVMDSKTITVMEKKFNMKIGQRAKNAFEKLGINVFNHLFGFLEPFEVIGIMSVSKFLSEKLKNEMLWKYYMEGSRSGKFVYKALLPEHFEVEDLKSNYYETFRSTFIKSLVALRPPDPEARSEGLHLFPNINQL